MLARSARHLREADDLGVDDPWQEERQRGASQRTSLLVFVTLLAVVWIGIFFGNPADSTSSSDNRIDGRPAPIGSTIGRFIGRPDRLSLSEGLESGGLGMWKDLKKGSAWTQEGAYVRPGRLRIWSPSESLANYDFEFVGQIDRKSLDWAFRAVDSRNYYASKVAILTPETTVIVRYAVLNGVVSDRMELPLPLNLSANRDYHFRMTAQGSRFRTFIDGRIVSSWNDARISRGGIGFFSDDGERSLLKWASLTERDSLAGRVLSHFSALLFPAPALLEINHVAANRAMLGW